MVRLRYDCIYDRKAEASITGFTLPSHHDYNCIQASGVEARKTAFKLSSQS
jgi:hypothetical protein